MVGGREADTAKVLMDDLKARRANRVQLTTDGLKAYLEAVSDAFGDEIAYRAEDYRCPSREHEGALQPRRTCRCQEGEDHWQAG